VSKVKELSLILLVCKSQYKLRQRLAALADINFESLRKQKNTRRRRLALLASVEPCDVDAAVGWKKCRWQSFRHWDRSKMGLWRAPLVSWRGDGRLDRPGKPYRLHLQLQNSRRPAGGVTEELGSPDRQKSTCRGSDSPPRT
jgi:hypothetical protein